MNIIELGEKIIASYDLNEKKAKEEISIYLSRCFSPLTFNAFNFLTRVESSRELWKFADSQQEFRTAYFGKYVMDLFSNKELKFIKNISIKYGELQKDFKRRTNPVGINHQLSSLPSLRILSQIKEKLGESPSVFEIGGGSGMLGHMCFEQGYKYSGFDITQSFYIFNSAVYSLLYKDSFMDTHTLTKLSNLNKKIFKDYQILMLPWWHFVNENFPLPKFNVVVMNHCFFEISKKALVFILSRLSYAVNGRVYLIVSGWGSNDATSHDNYFLSCLEKEFNFRIEEFSGDSNINPKGTVLLSFEKQNPYPDIYSLSFDERLDFKEYESNYRKSKNIFLKNIYEKLITPLNQQREKLKPKFIGSEIPSFNGTLKEFKEYNKNFNDLKNVICEIERVLGKKIYTEDEALGFYINRLDHA